MIQKNDAHLKKQLLLIFFIFILKINIMAVRLNKSNTTTPSRDRPAVTPIAVATSIAVGNVLGVQGNKKHLVYSNDSAFSPKSTSSKEWSTSSTGSPLTRSDDGRIATVKGRKTVATPAESGTISGSQEEKNSDLVLILQSQENQKADRKKMPKQKQKDWNKSSLQTLCQPHKTKPAVLGAPFRGCFTGCYMWLMLFIFFVSIFPLSKYFSRFVYVSINRQSERRYIYKSQKNNRY